MAALGRVSRARNRAQVYSDVNPSRWIHERFVVRGDQRESSHGLLGPRNFAQNDSLVFVAAPLTYILHLAFLHHPNRALKMRKSLGAHSMNLAMIKRTVEQCPARVHAPRRERERHGRHGRRSRDRNLPSPQPRRPRALDRDVRAPCAGAEQTLRGIVGGSLSSSGRRPVASTISRPRPALAAAAAAVRSRPSPAR